MAMKLYDIYDFHVDYSPHCVSACPFHEAEEEVVLYLPSEFETSITNDLDRILMVKRDLHSLADDFERKGMERMSRLSGVHTTSFSVSFDSPGLVIDDPIKRIILDALKVYKGVAGREYFMNETEVIIHPRKKDVRIAGVMSARLGSRWDDPAMDVVASIDFI